jgi:hypothetical protein
MYTVSQTLTIHSPPSLVFSTLLDLPNYNTWLPLSSSFKGTTKISDNPIRAGTTYVEIEPSGVRHGEILELNSEERKVVFHQPMTLKPAVLGIVVDVTVCMVVRGVEREAKDGERQDGEGKAGGVGQWSRVEREVRLGLPLILRPVSGIVSKLFHRESWRTLEMLKKHMERE